MKSTTGQHFQTIDHMRGIAAFMVFVFHFMFLYGGHLAPPQIFPLSLLTEGHTGVAVFMTLSGYLFAKLIGSQDIEMRPFMWNRILRLGPLFFLMMGPVSALGYYAEDLWPEYIRRIMGGVIRPSLPNGGWSITVEFHFYLLLPFILLLARKSRAHVLWIILFSILLRTAIFAYSGEVQTAAYWTIIGRIDQFVCGIFCWINRDFFKDKGKQVAAIAACFACFWYWFDLRGGLFAFDGYPSPAPVWIILPTIEAITYGALIAWYDNSCTGGAGWLSRALGWVGVRSYSIYMIHFVVVTRMGMFVDAHIVNLSNRYMLLLMSVPCFLALLPLADLSYRYIERPFFKYRKPYLRDLQGS